MAAGSAREGDRDVRSGLGRRRGAGAVVGGGAGGRSLDARGGDGVGRRHGQDRRRDDGRRRRPGVGRREAVAAERDVRRSMCAAEMAEPMVQAVHLRRPEREHEREQQGGAQGLDETRRGSGTADHGKGR